MDPPGRLQESRQAHKRSGKLCLSNCKETLPGSLQERCQTPRWSGSPSFRIFEQKQIPCHSAAVESLASFGRAARHSSSSRDLSPSTFWNHIFCHVQLRSHLEGFGRAARHPQSAGNLSAGYVTKRFPCHLAASDTQEGFGRAARPTNTTAP